MSKKDDLKYDVISNIDDDIIDKSTKERAALWGRSPKNGKKLWMTVAAAAACFAIILTAIVVLLPSVGKQIPIYQGMTVSSEAPIVQNSDALASNGMTLMSVESGLGYSFEMLDEKDHGVGNNNGNGVVGNGENTDESDERGEGGNRLEDAVNDSFISAESQEGMYYAKKNEDIYIYVHISNPDGFEILSFTLNGVKYSSYMFEEGSDLETLVLKVNVGDGEGVLEYTIDAIKYVDGEKIKDVRMEGDRTVKVTVYPEQQPEAEITGESIGFTDVGFKVSVSDELGLLADSEGELYAVLYDGEQLVYNNKINATDTVTFADLKPGTLYQYAIVGVYDALDGNGRSSHIIAEKAFYTKAVLAFEDFTITGLTADFSLVWGEGFEDEHILSIALYEGENKLRDIAANSTSISKLPMEKELSIVIEYTHGSKTRTVSYGISPINQSEGLIIAGGKVIGRGACTDTELYINMPIDEKAFFEDKTVKKVYLGDGVTSIGKQAFNRCENLTTVTIGDGVTSIGEQAFSQCDNLTTVTIGNGVKSIGEYAFDGCNSLTSIEIPDSVTSIGAYAFRGCESLEIIEIPLSVTQMGECVFEECNSLKQIYLEAESRPSDWAAGWAYSSANNLPAIPPEIIWNDKGTQSETNAYEAVRLVDGQMIVADGVKDAAWNDAKPIDISYVIDGDAGKTATAKAYMMWDEGNIYLLIEVTDSTYNPFASDKAIEQNDGVEIRLDLLHKIIDGVDCTLWGDRYRGDAMVEAGFKTGAGVDYGANVFGEGSVAYWEWWSNYIKDEDPQTSAIASGKTDTGYIVEYKLDASFEWIGEYRPHEGQRIGFGALIFDKTDDGINKIAITPEQEFMSGPDTLSTVILVDNDD